MPNSDPWGPPRIPFMTICVFYVNPQIPILKILKHMRSTNPGRYLIFLLIKFPFEWRQNHVWGPIFDPSYDHIYKNIHFCKCKGREGKGRKGGREEARKGGREEGRKRGREEGRKGGREEGRKEPFMITPTATRTLTSAAEG